VHYKGKKVKPLRKSLERRDGESPHWSDGMGNSPEFDTGINTHYHGDS
jgi:hypothetical protein